MKKLLALDGGGIRGLISVEYLARIEELLRAHFGRPDLVLADYFDYVAGTSTGAIIATCLALGMSTDTIRRFYLEAGPEMFEPARVHLRFQSRFAAHKFGELLRRTLGAETTLGSEKLRTLLTVVMRNASTSSPWPLSNNPRARFNDRARADCNLNLPLWQLVRASTAAPVFFPPEVIDVGEQQFVFVDGAVTTYNNPAFLLFLMATIEPYRLGWPTGEDDLLLVSVGTGLNSGANKNLKPGQMNLLYNATSIPSALIHAAAVEQDLLCRVFGATRFGDSIDGELGNLSGMPSPAGPKAFTYVRYNVELSREGLDALGLSHVDPAHVQPLDQVGHLPTLRGVGETAARRHFELAHLAGFLELRPSESELHDGA
jgi:hypothetical protein